MNLFYRTTNTIVIHSRTEQVEQEREDGTTAEVTKALPDLKEQFKSINAAKRKSRDMQKAGHRFVRPA